MKMHKKPALLTLAALLILSILASCANGSPSTESASTTAAIDAGNPSSGSSDASIPSDGETSNPSTTNSETSISSATNPEATETQIPETDNSLLDFVALKMVMVGPEMDSYERIIPMVNEKLKEDLNCSLSVDFLDWSDWNTKYPLMFGSGEEFDMAYTSNWAFYTDTAVKNGFMPLDMEDVKTYMPRINDNVTEDMWKGSIVNDKMYMVPQTGLQFTGDHNLFLVRGDLMMKYGISEIKDANGLINYWERVVANDPDLIPIAASNVWTGYDIVQAILGGNPWLGMEWGNGVYQVYNLSDPNNVTIVPEEEYWAFTKKRYEMARDFLNRGFWSRDALSQTDDVNVMFQNGIGASTIGAIVYLNEIYEKANANHPEWDIEMIDINPNLPAVYYPVTGDGMAFHANTKHKERAMQLLDIISYDRVYYDLIYYGVEGEDYILNGDGSFTWMGDPVNVGFRGMNNNISRPSSTVAPIFVETLERFKKVGFYPPMQNFNYDDTAVQTQRASISALEDKYDNIAYLGFIDGDIDAYIAEFRQALKDADIETLQNELLRNLQIYMSTYYN